MKPSDRFLGLGFFVNPWVMMAVLTMVLNDHYLKQAYANSFTGKLSDFCGLFFFPLFLSAALLLLFRGFGQGRRLTWKGLLLAIVMADSFFILLNLSPGFNLWYEKIMYRIGLPSESIMDPTDLWALVMNGPTYLLARKSL